MAEAGTGVVVRAGGDAVARAVAPPPRGRTGHSRVGTAVLADLAVFAAVATAYAVLSRSALVLFAIPMGLAGFFPAAGVGLAALLMLRRRRWPAVLAGVAVAELVADLAQGYALAPSLGYALANGAEPLVGALLFRWLTRHGEGLDTRTGVGAFALAALAAGPALGAALGTVVNVSFFGSDPVTSFTLWWAGDALGVLVVGATVLAWARTTEAWTGSALEWVVILATIAGLTMSLFVLGDRPLSYLPLAALLWAALRLGVRGVLTGGLVMAVLSMILTVRGYGPWPEAAGSPEAGLTYLKLFLVVAIAPAWLLAVEVGYRRRAEARESAEQRARESAREVSEQLARLRRLTAALSGATTREEVARAWVAGSRGVLGGRRRCLYLLSQDRTRLELLAEDDSDGTGGPAALGGAPVGGGVTATSIVPPEWLSLPVDGDSDHARALRDGTTVTRLLPGEDGVLGVCAPLVGRRGAEGVASFVHDVGGAGGPEAAGPDALTLAAVAERVCDALERVRLLDEARSAGERMQVLQRLTSRLVSAPTLEAVTGLALRDVPDALGARGARLMVPDRTGRALVDAERVGSTASSARRLPPSAVSLSSGEDLARAAVEGTVRVVGTSDGVRSALLPLRSQGRLRGVLCLEFGPRAGGLSPADHLPFLAALAQQVALALGRAGRAAREHEAAVQLQRALLPHRFPSVPGVAVAARYLPGTEGLSVGGDWYDLVACTDGRAVAVVGDVVGHDLVAAAAMGQVRAAVAAVAVQADGPADTLRRLDTFPVGDEVGFTTLCLADYCPVTGRLRYACAGHPPPLLIGPDGTVEVLRDGRSKPLYVLPGGLERTEAELTVAPGSRLVCYTDGLVERPERSLEDGVAELAVVCREHRELGVAAFADAVLDAVTRGVPPRDDAAVMCLTLG